MFRVILYLKKTFIINNFVYSLYLDAFKNVSKTYNRF